MKTHPGKIVVVAAWMIASTPLVSFAQNLPGQSGSVTRGLDRLTLLPGPSLLSPARGAPQFTPVIGIAPAGSDYGPTLAPTVPAAHFLSGKGKLTLGQTEPQLLRNAPSASERSAARPAKVLSPPTPESLRFKATLPPATPALKLNVAPTPKRD